jgi:hypothetical protein
MGTEDDCSGNCAGIDIRVQEMLKKNPLDSSTA